jgi:nitrile hydratase subunit beta
MNGIHDMGGMHGMGPIEAEKDEPVFHERWEARTYVLTRAMNAWRKWNIDTGRFGIEQIPPADYLRMSYYEKWFVKLTALLVETGLVSRSELESGKPDAGSTKMTPALPAERVEGTALGRGIEASYEPGITPQFEIGQTVRAKNINPAGHTRLPQYARGKVGRIHLDHGVYNLPDSNAHGLGEKRQHVYSVRFEARELWGDDASPRDAVYLDMWDDYLEQA